MEVELKFLVEEPIAREKILGDKHLAEIMDEGSLEEIKMQATYFDTEDLDLCNSGIAFRIRRENAQPVATLKWGGKVEHGLHMRGELNVTVDENYAKEPSLDIFKGSEIYDIIEKAAGDKPLRALLEANCIRKQMRVDTGKSINVVSLDVGEIVTEKGTAPISELEVELYSGDKEDMIELGRELATKYNLVEGSKSKFQVGLELLGYKKENM
ncbi:MAG: CYTH domain-containing protein [Firmicutes bacterium]|nr:CYTH domain-containing protein [Bacillota bacterium]